jgi:hypothetical protein
LDCTRQWPVDLAEAVGRVYEEWRIHISDPLNLSHPEEAETQEFLRYYLIGNESIVGRLLQAVFRIHRIHVFFGLPDPDPLVRCMDPDPDPSVIMQK